jgi:hypothetical protein
VQDVRGRVIAQNLVDLVQLIPTCPPDGRRECKVKIEKCKVKEKIYQNALACPAGAVGRH